MARLLMVVLSVLEMLFTSELSAWNERHRLLTVVLSESSLVEIWVVEVCSTATCPETVARLLDTFCAYVLSESKRELI